MRNPDRWRETKYVLRDGRISATTDRSELSPASALVATLVARLYHRELPVHARGRLLDLGCGKVPLFGVYRPLVDTVTCVDWGQSLHDSDFIDQDVDISGELPFPDATFDTVILSDVLEHIPTPGRLCREIARILRVDGKVLLNVPFYYPIHEAPHDFYRYSEFALRRLLQDAGLRVLTLESVGGAPEIMADIAGKLVLMRGGRSGTVGAIAIQRVVLAALQTGLGRRVSLATRDRFPLGYFVVAQKPRT